MTKKRTEELLDSIFALLSPLNEGHLLNVFLNNIKLNEGETNQLVEILEKLTLNGYLRKGDNNFYILTEKGEELKKAQIIVKHFNNLFNC